MTYPYFGNFINYFRPEAYNLAEVVADEEKFKREEFGHFKRN